MFWDDGVEALKHLRHFTSIPNPKQYMFVNRSNWEGGLLETLTLDLGKPLQASKSEREKQVSLLAQYFRCKRRREHVTYTAKMMLCEFLNSANVLGQLYLMHLFLGGHFATYGSDVFALTEQVKMS